MSRAADRRTPVILLSGFLGSGKTTLLNRILEAEDAARTAVIVNEFGEISLDHLLIREVQASRAVLKNGCVCCVIRSDLQTALRELLDGMEPDAPPFERIVIETTGLADPAPVLQAIMGNPVIAQSFALDGVVTVVDAVNGLSTLASHAEAMKQAAVADRIVLTKTTLADAGTVAAVRGEIAALNPRAAVTDAEAPITPDLLANGLYDPETKSPDVRRWLHEEAHGDGHHHHHHHEHGHGHDHHHHQHVHDVTRHDATIRSFSIVHDRPIDPMALDMFVDLLRSAHGEKLLRMKAIVQLSTNPERPVVLHGVQSVFHPPERLAAWPDPSDRRTRMVLITRDLPEAFVRDLFDAFTGTPKIDRPDRAALEDNPLAVPGFRF